MRSDYKKGRRKEGKKLEKQGERGGLYTLGHLERFDFARSKETGEQKD